MAEPRQILHPFYNLIVSGGLRRIRRDFIDHRWPLGREDKCYNPKTDSLEWEARDEDGDWVKCSRSYKEHLRGIVTPYYSKALAEYDQEIIKRASDAEIKILHKIYLERLHRFYEELKRFQPEEGAELMKICLRNLKKEINDRTPTALDSKPEPVPPLEPKGSGAKRGRPFKKEVPQPEVLKAVVRLVNEERFWKNDAVMPTPIRDELLKDPRFSDDKIKPRALFDRVVRALEELGYR